MKKTATIQGRAEANLEFPLISMEKIRPEIKDISVAWHESATNWIGDKVKLASDIQNYANWYATQETAPLQESLTQYKTLYEELEANQKPLETRRILAEAKVGVLQERIDELEGENKKLLNALTDVAAHDDTSLILLDVISQALNKNNDANRK